MLALEIPMQEHQRIDDFLRSKGSDADRAALVSGPFWQRDYQDGRSSEARLEMLESVRVLIAKRAPIRVRTIDDAGRDPKRRDEAMANELLSARTPSEVAIALLGNLHVRTHPGAPWDPKVVWAGVYLRRKEPALISLDNRYGAGEAWICTSDNPSDCGVKPMKGRGEPRAFGIELFHATDEDGLDGVFDVGAAVASKPASRPTG